MRFIWLPVKHAANSYPLVPYGAYVPVAPTKLYSDPNEEKSFAHNLPNIAVVLVSKSMKKISSSADLEVWSVDGVDGVFSNY